MIHATTQMKLKDIILGEISQTQQASIFLYLFYYIFVSTPHLQPISRKNNGRRRIRKYLRKRQEEEAREYANSETERGTREGANLPFPRLQRTLQLNFP